MRRLIQEMPLPPYVGALRSIGRFYPYLTPRCGLWESRESCLCASAVLAQGVWPFTVITAGLALHCNHCQQRTACAGRWHIPGPSKAIVPIFSMQASNLAAQCKPRYCSTCQPFPEAHFFITSISSSPAKPQQGKVFLLLLAVVTVKG